MPQDLLPRIFQADLDRLYTLVVRPALGSLPCYDGVKTTGYVVSITEFLDHAEMHTSNLLAFEARRCFALMLAGLFERQLRIWARLHLPENQRAAIGKLEFDRLVREADERHGLDLKSEEVGDTIKELHLLANAVRHGDGRSVDDLRGLAPYLWRYADGSTATKSEEQSILSEGIELSDADLARYMRAVTRFWGLADCEPGAVHDAPY